MSTIKPSDHGIVVEHKESGVRFAVSDANHDPKSERKVRDLRAGESVLSYVPKLGPGAGGEQDEESEDSERKAREDEAAALAAAEADAAKAAAKAEGTPSGDAKASK